MAMATSALMNLRGTTPHQINTNTLDGWRPDHQFTGWFVCRWFLDKAVALSNLAQKLNKPKPEVVEPVMTVIAPEVIEAPEEVLSEARKKFDELDTDKSGVIDGPEVQKLFEFVLSKIARPSTSQQKKTEDAHKMMGQVPGDKV